MAHRFNRFVLWVLLFIGLPYYWLFMDNRPGHAAPKPLTVAQLRTLAAQMPGPAPDRVEVEASADRLLPRNLFMAGTGMKRTAVTIMAFRLPVPGRGAIMIDSGINPIDARDMGMRLRKDGEQTRIESALRQADLVLFTHEHTDHIGALVRLGRPALDRALFNSRQIMPARLVQNLPWPAPWPPARLTATAPAAVAPGVVVIPAPSHTPGSQMIYARLANGREYLFAGDISTFDNSWRTLHARSRIVGDWLAPENRDEVYAWLRTIQALKREAPGLVVVSGHDYGWISMKEFNPGLIHLGFGPNPGAATGLTAIKH